MAPAATMGSAKIMTTLPADGKTVTNYYKQNVYDTADNKIGDIQDLLVDKSGKISAALIGVGGFLGIGEKDVAVPFEALQLTQKNNKWYLVMNSTKDELKNAPGWKYDRTTTTWISDKTAAAPAAPRPSLADRAPAPTRQ
jgi:sporulation protein YlmC with PRC-barrel domain